jgi:glucan biosynthesis protein C
MPNKDPGDLRESTMHTAGARHHVHYLDPLRILLCTLVVFLHAAITYGAPGNWYYIETQAQGLSFVILVLFVATNQAFFMGLFFFLAGFFTPASFDRKGPRLYIRDRLIRLGVPILVYWLLLDPLTCFIRDKGTHSHQGTSWQWLMDYLKTYHGFRTGPLWFVQLLLGCSILYALVRSLRPRIEEGRPRANWKPHGMTLALIALVIGLVSFVVRLRFPVNRWVDYVNIQPAHLCQYVCFFVGGIMAHRRGWLESIPMRIGRSGIVTVAVCIVILFPLQFALSGATHQTASFLGGMHWQAMGYALWEQAIGVGMSMALLYLFQRHLSGQGPLVQELARDTYAVYILHAPVLVAVAIAMRNLHLPPLAKAVLAGSLATASCFALSSVIRCLPGARSVPRGRMAIKNQGRALQGGL